MYDYIKGTVTYLKNNAIVLDNNGVGYLIYVSNPYSFKEKEEYKEKYKLNFGVYFTPAENLCHTALKKFKARYGVIRNVSDKEFFTNSMHVPVWKEMSPFDKIDIEVSGIIDEGRHVVKNLTETFFKEPLIGFFLYLDKIGHFTEILVDFRKAVSQIITSPRRDDSDIIYLYTLSNLFGGSLTMIRFTNLFTAATTGAADATVAGTGSMLMTIVPFILVFALMYFFMIRPQKKKEKEKKRLEKKAKKN